MKEQKLMRYGFVSYTGVQFTNEQVDTYNALTRRIMMFGENPPQELLNGRHNLFVSFSTPTQKPQPKKHRSH